MVWVMRDETRRTNLRILVHEGEKITTMKTEITLQYESPKRCRISVQSVKPGFFSFDERDLAYEAERFLEIENVMQSLVGSSNE